jgi:hypothetical protein
MMYEVKVIVYFNQFHHLLLKLDRDDKGYLFINGWPKEI